MEGMVLKEKVVKKEPNIAEFHKALNLLSKCGECNVKNNRN